jgi:hypothetical protein
VPPFAVNTTANNVSAPGVNKCADDFHPVSFIKRVVSPPHESYVFFTFERYDEIVICGQVDGYDLVSVWCSEVVSKHDESCFRYSSKSASKGPFRNSSNLTPLAALASWSF